MIQTNSIFDKINFNGGNLSSDGGSILLSQFLEKMNLRKLLDSIPFVDLRHLPVYSNTNILFQQIIKCLLGYNDQSDQKVLINDPLLSLKSLICSQATVSRFYDRVSLNTTNEFKKIITQLACDFVNTNIDDPILDADSTMVTTCGNQEASAYIHHYQENGYHPLVINEYHSKLLLSSLLRTGSAYSSNGIIEELEQIFTQLLHRVHVRACVRHRHRDQLDPEISRHRKMPVVAGDGAEELDLALPAPRRFAAYAAAVCRCDIVEHHVQAGVAAHDHRRGIHVQHVAEQALCLRQPVQQTVVAHVHPVLGAAAVPLVDAFQHIQRQIQLFRAGLAARHIQLQPLGLIAAVKLRQLRFACVQLALGHLVQLFRFLSCHVRSPLLFVCHV